MYQTWLPDPVQWYRIPDVGRASDRELERDDPSPTRDWHQLELNLTRLGTWIMIRLRLVTESESWPPSRILSTWHKRVYTCLYHVYDMYILCYSVYIWYTWYRHVHTFLDMYEHAHTFWNIYKHVCTWYVHVHIFSGMNMYVHRSDMYLHVYTSTNQFWISNTCTWYLQTCTTTTSCAKLILLIMSYMTSYMIS
jgi:hypothetical protein